MIRIDMLPGGRVSAPGIEGKMTVYKLARRLIDDGCEPSDMTQVYRGTMRVFVDTPLSWWAERDVTEGDGYSARIVKHKPFDGTGVWK